MVPYEYMFSIYLLEDMFLTLIGVAQRGEGVIPAAYVIPETTLHIRYHFWHPMYNKIGGDA